MTKKLRSNFVKIAFLIIVIYSILFWCREDPEYDKGGTFLGNLIIILMLFWSWLAVKFNETDFNKIFSKTDPFLERIYDWLNRRNQI